MKYYIAYYTDSAYISAMSTSQNKIVTAVTLAPDLRIRLDAEAARQDRSRSWITAEAIKEYLARRAAISNDR
jgi:metal-responsive CopG/Arc/MetJ family transcriptional regulator